jgi:hypothetical protein
MKVNKQNSINHIGSRFGDETAQVYSGLVKDYPETIPMSDMFAKFSEARRIVQARKPAPSPAVVSFRSKPADTNINEGKVLTSLEEERRRMRLMFRSQDMPFNS